MKRMWTGSRFATRVILAVATVAVAACASSSSGAGSGGAITLGLVGPFTGADAPFGANFIAACTAATQVINTAGGVMGHHLKCLETDTRGDPADAVPAVDKMLAATSSLVGILGPTGDEATAVAPAINAAKIPFFSTSGESALDKWTYPYFYRMVTPDNVTGYAMALWAHKQGYRRAAAVFGNDISSQGTVPTLTAGLKKLGSPALDRSSTLILDQNSYRSEILSLLSLNPRPEVLFSELDPQTASTFFSELKDLSGGRIPFHVVLANNAVDPTWYQPVAKTIGYSTLAKSFVVPNSVVATSGPAWQQFSAALHSAKGRVTDPAKYETNGITQADYDAATLMALAMAAAKSTDPKTYNPWIVKITKATADAKRVDTYKAGVAALAAGKAIQFEGLRGGVVFNQWHNAPAGVGFENYTASGAVVPASGGLISAQQIIALQ
jgi:branched-chain amino acid transport system substrate-binding protein